MYKQDYRVRTYYVDKNNIAKPSGILQEMQEAADRQMATQRPSYEEIFSSGKALMLNRFDVNILKEIKLEDTITAGSWPCPSKRATFLRCYAMWRGEELMAEASSQWSLVGIEDRKILTVDDVDFSNYDMYEYKEAAKGKLKITPSLEADMKPVGEKLVGYSDSDCNGHMNNTYYLDVLCNFIPELAAATHRVSSVRIHYSKEATIGDTFRILRSENLDGKYYFKTTKEDGDMNIAAEIGITGVR